jgi:hypothetical protein
MKKFNYTIQIPEPCHEDWNTMQADAQGKFCGSCNKSVIDFSNKSDMEIKNILLEQKGKKICGHFKKTQVDRPLNFRVDLNQLPKNVSSTKAFAISLFLVFGTLLFSCKDINGQTIGKIEVIESETAHYTKGKLSTPRVITREDTLPKNDTIHLIEIEEPKINGDVIFIETPFTEDSLLKICPPPIVFDTLFVEPMIMGGMMANIIDDEVSEELPSLPEVNSENEKDSPFIKFPDLQVYPNPSKGEFTVSYEVVTRTNVELIILDTKGVLVKKIVDQKRQHEGLYHIPVQLTNLPDEIYLVQLIVGDKKLTEKLILKK